MHIKIHKYQSYISIVDIWLGHWFTTTEPSIHDLNFQLAIISNNFSFIQNEILLSSINI